MNQTILITNGNVFSMLALADWIRRNGATLAKVYVTYRLPSEQNRIAGVLRLLKNSGFSYTHFKVWTNLILPRMLRARGLPAGVEDLLRRYRLTTQVQYVASVNSPDIVAEVKAMQPDWLVSFSATQRFGDHLIQIPTRGAINTHWGALPQFAGLSPYFWHLALNAPEFGVTLHKIESKLDSGPIINQTIRPIGTITTALELVLNMAQCVSPMLNRLFDGLTDLRHATPQDHARRTYHGHPNRDQMRQFQRAGCRMLDRHAKGMLLDQIRRLARQPFDSAPP